jgi:hypothetical protein
VRAPLYTHTHTHTHTYTHTHTHSLAVSSLCVVFALTRRLFTVCRVRTQSPSLHCVSYPHSLAVSSLCVVFSLTRRLFTVCRVRTRSPSLHCVSYPHSLTVFSLLCGSFCLFAGTSAQTRSRSATMRFRRSCGKPTLRRRGSLSREPRLHALPSGPPWRSS